MDARGQFVATLIDHSCRSLAAGAITRLSEADADGVEAWGFQALVADMQVRLQNLAEALAAGRPELACLDVEWVATTHVARGVSLDFLKRSLECLHRELDQALPQDAAALATSYLDQTREKLVQPDAQPTVPLADGQPHAQLVGEYLLAVLEARRADAEKLLLEAFEAGVSVPELHRHVIAPVQSEIGRMWQLGEAHAGEEHLASRIVEEGLAVLRTRMPRAEPTGRSVLVASVRGNLHDIGARIVADQFEMAGWRSLFLGANTPSEDLIASVGHFKADVVALSVGLGLHVRATAELVQWIHADHPDVPVLVGGRPFGLVPDLWRTVGADGFALSAELAVSEAERLVQGGTDSSA